MRKKVAVAESAAKTLVLGLAIGIILAQAPQLPRHRQNFSLSKPQATRALPALAQ